MNVKYLQYEILYKIAASLLHPPPPVLSLVSSTGLYIDECTGGSDYSSSEGSDRK